MGRIYLPAHNFLKLNISRVIICTIGALGYGPVGGDSTYVYICRYYC